MVLFIIVEQGCEKKIFFLEIGFQCFISGTPFEIIEINVPGAFFYSFTNQGPIGSYFSKMNDTCKCYH